MLNPECRSFGEGLFREISFCLSNLGSINSCRFRSRILLGICTVVVLGSLVQAQSENQQTSSITDVDPREDGSTDQETRLQQSPTQPPDPQYKYGGFIDAAYLLDFNYPSNHLFRSRGTAYKVNEPIMNMAGAYLQKNASESSRWGMQLTVQAGQDSRVFGFSATAPNLPGSKWLRHLGPTNVAYLAPVGKGLILQGGIFSSFIGYDSLYTKDNFEYTRPWGADFTPYLMLGVNATYPVTERLTIAGFLVNGYWHLANANSVPSVGGQVAYKPADHWTVKQAILVGPHQLPMHWAIDKHWSITVRPEVAWDSDGRWTLAQQTVKANTTTLEYRVPIRQANAILRLEHRIDDSRGPGGGFFNDGEIRPGVVGLTPTQNLLILGVILTFDSQFRP